MQAAKLRGKAKPVAAMVKMSEEKLAARAGARDFDRAEARPTRRRVLRIVAAAAGLPLMIAGVRATAPKGQLYSWHGEVLGAVSELTLWHTDAAFARAHDPQGAP